MMYHQDCFRSIVVLRSLRKRKVASSILAGSFELFGVVSQTYFVKSNTKWFFANNAAAAAADQY
jgi:hypothetical protein